jgi:hypothetical protein
MDIGMHDLAILPILAGDCFKFPPTFFTVANTSIPAASMPGCYPVHMPAFPVHALVYPPGGFFSNAVLVFTIYAGISGENSFVFLPLTLLPRSAYFHPECECRVKERSVLSLYPILFSPHVNDPLHNEA